MVSIEVDFHKIMWQLTVTTWRFMMLTAWNRQAKGGLAERLIAFVC